MNFLNVEFIKSAASERDFINDGLPQIAFAGRSNVGKSSVINKIVNRKSIARVGAKPGMTAHINYFLIDRTSYFADLPGYGYAKVSENEKKRWANLMETYFASGLINLDSVVRQQAQPTARCHDGKLVYVHGLSAHSGSEQVGQAEKERD